MQASGWRLAGGAGLDTGRSGRALRVLLREEGVDEGGVCPGMLQRPARATLLLGLCSKSTHNTRTASLGKVYG